MRRHFPKGSLIAGSLVAVLCLSACGGSDDAAAVATSTPAAATTEPAAALDTVVTADTVDTTVETIVDPAPVATDPVATDPAGERDCLVGDWVVDEEQMNSFYGALTSTMDSPVTINVVGVAPLSFGADGTYEWAPDFALMIEVAGQRGTGVTGGTITGDWTAVDGVVTTSSDVNALTMSISVGGSVIDGSDIGNGLLNASPVNGVTYSCDGATPVLDFKTGDPAVTVPVTLQPA